MTGRVDARLDALERTVVDLEAKADGARVVDGMDLARNLCLLLVKHGIITPTDQGFESDDRRQQVRNSVVEPDLVPLVGRHGGDELAADDEIIGQLGGSGAKVERNVVGGHDDSSSVGPDAATSGGEPTVEEGGDASAVDGDSSGGRVTHTRGARP